jgi:hypothetical protein
VALPRPQGAHVVLPAVEKWPVGHSVSKSTAFEKTLLPSGFLPAAQGMRHARKISTDHCTRISILNTNQNKRKASKITITQRTPTASEYRESVIRQRCGCRISSSYAENCGAPISRSRVEDVHNVDPTIDGLATSEDGDSKIRQRCGCKPTSL